MDDVQLTEQTEFVRFWNEVLVPKFVKYKHVLVGGLGQHSDAIFPKLVVPAGGHVMDAGCGFGDTACMLAERVGPEGAVVGIDCCEAFLDYGRKEAAERGLSNVSFAVADIESQQFDGDFDMIFSRFGTMFFTNPVRALRNMRTALKPGGTMTIIVWRARVDNHWGDKPKEVVLRHLPPPGEGAATCGPGPFSMADQEMVTGQLKAAGFADIAFERVDAPFRTGDSVEDAIGFQLALGPAGEVYREAGDLAVEKHDVIMADMREMLSAYETDDGVFLPSSSWVITAKNPG
ncbi:MAG: class I SAM-dependent methyltransferase [Pseudomonadota bacterium]